MDRIHVTELDHIVLNVRDIDRSLRLNCPLAGIVSMPLASPTREGRVFHQHRTWFSLFRPLYAATL